MNTIVKNAYWQWESVLSKEFCEFAISQLDWNTSVTGETFEGVEPHLRRSDVIWQPIMQPLGCIAKTYIDAANFYADWHYPINSLEDMQVSRYSSNNLGHYDKHMDTKAPKDGMQRKLSISILLSDPSEFEGGELQFTGIEDRKLLATQGSIIVFPSFIEHKVTPVTKGVRYSGVTWASGPAFR
jgi:PKHD-type hydroxylase